MDVEGLITDLALILLLGAVVTVVFKAIRQPVVLGYIVAGFLASPHFAYMPSVHNEANIEFWAQIGIVVLLFTLGLEFSFKRLLKAGSSAVVTALIIVIGMSACGWCAGRLMGMSNINCLFLGGMLSMSSTTIIIKALSDLGMRQRKFASGVFAVLVVEDLFAVVLMVILSSVAINNSLEGEALLMSVGTLAFFLVIWFIVGVYVIPTALNKMRRYLNGETLLVVSMGLCLGMAVFSVMCGFSLALGAFVMGSVLAGTSLAERIERVCTPVKDLFGAVFFISVGMMVQPTLIAQFWLPILLLSCLVVIGMIVFGTFGMLVTGQTLKVAMQSGFCLTQIGEFAFIIATLGMSLGVLDAQIYPIVVAVSVLTTFGTPYFIKASTPAYGWVERHLPRQLHFLIDRYQEETKDVAAVKADSWASVSRRSATRLLLYACVLIAISIMSARYLTPWLTGLTPQWGRAASSVLTLTAMAPFLIALVMPDHRLQGVSVPGTVWRLFRSLVALAFVVHVIAAAYSTTAAVSTAIAAAILIVMMLSRNTRRRLRRIEATFIDNLNERELRRSGRNNRVVSDLHIGYIEVGPECPFVGERLRNTGLRGRYGVSLVNLQRGPRLIPIPPADTRIFPGDILGVIGTDEQIQALIPVAERGLGHEVSDVAHDQYGLVSVAVTATSPLVGRNAVTAAIRNTYEAMVVALNRQGRWIDFTPSTVFAPGDIVWLVGDRTRLAPLLK